jgi:hypothetical protein
MRCDANAHHTMWGSTGTNPRGKSFMEFLGSSNLNILNHGNKPTFEVHNRKEVDFITWASSSWKEVTFIKPPKVKSYISFEV